MYIFSLRAAIFNKPFYYYYYYYYYKIKVYPKEKKSTSSISKRLPKM